MLTAFSWLHLLSTMVPFWPETLSCLCFPSSGSWSGCRSLCMGGIPHGKDPMWEDSVWEEPEGSCVGGTHVGGILCGRILKNPMWEDPEECHVGRSCVGGTPKYRAVTACVSISVGSGSACFQQLDGRAGGAVRLWPGPCGLKARHNASLERGPASSIQELACKCLLQVSFLPLLGLPAIS